MLHAHLPKCFWTHAITHATYLINRLPTRFLQHKSLFEILHQTIHNIQNLKVFYCLSFASTLTTQEEI